LVKITRKVLISDSLKIYFTAISSVGSVMSVILAIETTPSKFF
jgi:hypothetical protein